MNHKLFGAAIVPALIFLSACSSAPKEGVEIGRRMQPREYAELIKKHTRQNVQYDGFYNKFELYLTFVNSHVQGAMLQRKSDVLFWDQQTAQKEREKMFQENSTQTRFALSFFTPSARINDLHKANTIWKIYLESGGQRYVGRAQKRNGKLEELVVIYPYHNRWSIPYDVIFEVPLSAIESADSKFILTSPQGTAELQFDKTGTLYTN